MDDRINPYAAPQTYQEPIPAAGETLWSPRRWLRIILGGVLMLFALFGGGLIAARMLTTGIRPEEFPALAAVAVLSLASSFVGIWMVGLVWFRVLGQLVLTVLLLLVVLFFFLMA